MWVFITLRLPSLFLFLETLCSNKWTCSWIIRSSVQMHVQKWEFIFRFQIRKENTPGKFGSKIDRNFANILSNSFNRFGQQLITFIRHSNKSYKQENFFAFNMIHCKHFNTMYSTYFHYKNWYTSINLAIRGCVERTVYIHVNGSHIYANGSSTYVNGSSYQG